MSVAPLLVGLFSLALLGHALLSLSLMLYAWERPDTLERTAGPTTFSQPPTTLATCAFDPPIAALAVDASGVYALAPPGVTSTVYRFAR